MKLTQRKIENLECPAGKKDALVFDDEQAGLGVRVTASGGKSYLAQYTLAGTKRRVPLGSCSAISLASARDAVQAILGDVAKGRDPASERKQAGLDAKRKAANDALTFDALIEHWGSLHLAGRRKSYALEAARALRHAFPKHLASPAGELTRAIVVRLVDRLVGDGKGQMAASTARYGHACFRWAVKRGALSSNPFSDLPVVPTIKRERALTDDELRAIWPATERPGPFNLIVRMLILTGQRREEVAGMTWDELDGDLSTWTIPAARAKNGVVHVVPLSPQARAIITSAPRRERQYNQPHYVFPGMRGPFNGFGKAKAALDEECGVERWRLHDLRRTMATGLQKLGVRLEVTEATLNHVSGSRAGIVGIYQRHDYASEKRAALNAWGEHVAAIVEGRAASGNVTPLLARNA